MTKRVTRQRTQLAIGTVLAIWMFALQAKAQSSATNPYVRPMCSATVTTNCTPQVTSTGGIVPAWRKYSVVKIANGANGCASAKGCWQVNGVLGPNAAAAVAQTITWLAAPAGAALEIVRWKTSTACAGLVATTLTDLGTTAGASEFVIGAAYDLRAAAGAANLLWPVVLTPSLTSAATNWNITINGAAENIDDINNGCAFDVHVKWGVLP